jgi:hypothetical protein
VTTTLNEKLEAFRRRLRGPEASQQKRERVKGKDWVAILVSITALALSALTAYFSFVRQSEELRVFLGEIPLLTKADDGRLQLEGNLDIDFMNTGTRPIIVQSVSLIIGIPEGKDGGSKWCGLHPYQRDLEPLFDVDSFVVKEKNQSQNCSD